MCFQGEWMLSCALLVFLFFFNVRAEITTEPCVKFVSMVNCREVSAVCMDLFWGGEAWGRERGMGEGKGHGGWRGGGWDCIRGD